MKLGRWFVAAMAIVCSGACSKAPAPMSDAERAALADSVSQLVTESFANLAQNATPEKVLAYQVHGDEFVHVEQGAIYPTYDAVVRTVNAMYRPGTKLAVKLDDKRLTVLDRNVVVFTAMLNGVLTDSAGNEAPVHAAWTAVWHRTSEGWRIAADHESMAPPAPPAKPGRR